MAVKSADIDPSKAPSKLAPVARKAAAVILTGLALFAGSEAAFNDSADSGAPESYRTEVVRKLAKTFQDSHFGKNAHYGFSFLILFDGIDIYQTVGSDKDRISFGEDLQEDLGWVSDALYRRHGIAEYGTSESSLATKLIDPAVMQLLEQQHYEFVPVSPVNCDNPLGYDSSRDFTNHATREDFKVKIVNGVTQIPLMAEPHSSQEEIFNNQAPLGLRSLNDTCDLVYGSYET